MIGYWRNPIVCPSVLRPSVRLSVMLCIVPLWLLGLVHKDKVVLACS